MTSTIDRLTRDELKTITGTPQRERQVRWLTRHGWPHEVDVNGYPVVLRSFALERLGGEAPDEAWTLDEKNVA